jgi:hypothetical protein
MMLTASKPAPFYLNIYTLDEVRLLYPEEENH